MSTDNVGDCHLLVTELAGSEALALLMLQLGAASMIKLDAKREIHNLAVGPL